MPNWHWLLNSRVLELACIAILMVANNVYTFQWQRRWSADKSRKHLSVWARVSGYLLSNVAALILGAAAWFSFTKLWSWTHSLGNTLLIWDLPIVVITVVTYLIPNGRVYLRTRGRGFWLSTASSLIVGFPVSFVYLFLKYSLIISWMLLKDPLANFLMDSWRGIKYNVHRFSARCWNFGNGISVGVTNLRYDMTASLLSWLTGAYVDRGYRHRTYRY